MLEEESAAFNAEQKVRFEHLLKGEAIVGVEVESGLDRLNAVVLILGDGRHVRFGVEVSYADDWWLDVDEIPPSEGLQTTPEEER